MTNILRWTKRKKMPVINDDSLLRLLIDKHIINNKDDLFQCHECNKKIYIADVGAVVMQSHTVQVVCSNLECLSKAQVEEK